MDFIDKLQDIAQRIPRTAEHIEGNEEATKNALIMPFIQALGYDVFDPLEVVPEFTADVGTKKGEKVDYALIQEGKPIILIECKAYGKNLGKVHASQLYRYFSVTEARFGILTNGAEYRFYSDLEAANIMDKKPFLVLDITDIDPTLVDELKKFTKAFFDVDDILSKASELKYTREIKRTIRAQIVEPDAEFVKYFASQAYDGRMTQPVIEQFTVIVQLAFEQVIDEYLNERLQSALSGAKHVPEDDTADEDSVDDEEEVKPGRQIITTQDELDGYFTVKSILREVVEPNRIAMRDTKSYCGILLDDNNRKPICRLYFNRTQKYIQLYHEGKDSERTPIDTVDCIYQYADQLKATIVRYDGE